MYVLLRYSVGLIVEGVILAKGQNRMRIAAAGFPDTIELTCDESQWFAPSSEPVEIDFMMSDAMQVEELSPAVPLQVAVARSAVS